MPQEMKRPGFHEHPQDSENPAVDGNHTLLERQEKKEEGVRRNRRPRAHRGLRQIHRRYSFRVFPVCHEKGGMRHMGPYRRDTSRIATLSAD